MNFRSLLSKLQYRGLVRSVKRKYHVAEATRAYVVFSPGRKASGNFTVVDARGTDYLQRRLGGKRSITSADAFKACKRSRFLSERFAVLNALYVLVGTQRARISKVVGQTLYFDVRKPTGRGDR